MKISLLALKYKSSILVILLTAFILFSFNYTFLYADSTMIYFLSAIVLLIAASYSLVTLIEIVEPKHIQGMGVNRISQVSLGYWVLTTSVTLLVCPWYELIANQQFIAHLIYLPIYLITIFYFKRDITLPHKILLGSVSLAVPLIVQFWYNFFLAELPYDGNGLMVSSNLLAIYLVMALFTILQFWTERSWIKFILVVLLIITIIATGSRSAILALVASSLFIMSMKIKHKFNLGYLAVGSLIILVSLFMLLYLIRPSSVKGRILLWEMGLSSIDFRHLLIGNGLGFIARHVGDLQANFFRNRPLHDQLMIGDVRTILNEYLRIFIEVGLLGLTCLAVIFYNATRIFINNKKYFLAGVMISIVIFSASSYPFASVPVCIFIVFIFVYARVLSTIPDDDLSQNGKRATTKNRYLYLGVSIMSILLMYETLTYGLTVFRWKQLSGSLMVQYNEARFQNEYRSLYQTLCNDPDFLSDYAAKLQLLGYYGQASSLLKKAVDIQSNLQLLLQLGYNQQQLKEYDQAEVYYKRAIAMQPKTFIPKYMLFDLYRILKDQERAKTIAAEIATFPVKVPSKEVREIKQEAIIFLNNNPYDGN